MRFQDVWNIWGGAKRCETSLWTRGPAPVLESGTAPGKNGQLHIFNLFPFVKTKQLPLPPPLPTHEKRGHVVGFVFPFHAPDQHHCYHQNWPASLSASALSSISTKEHQHLSSIIITMISITLFTIVSMSSISCGAGLSFGVAIPSPSSRV